MDVLALIRKNAGLKRLVWKALRLRIKPGLVHRALRAEWTLRHTIGSELLRIFYYQPMFELACASVGEGARLDLTPDSKMPVVDRCALVLGERVRVNGRTTFTGARNAPSLPRIELGDDTYMGSRCVFRAGLGIRVGKRVLFASNVVVASDPGHPMDAVARRTEAAPLEELKQIVIGDDVWIGEGATILGGVTIGEGAVIATKSVVTKDVPPYTVVAGIPARVVRSLREEPARKAG